MTLLLVYRYTDSHRNNKELEEACSTGHILSRKKEKKRRKKGRKKGGKKEKRTREKYKEKRQTDGKGKEKNV